MQYNRVILGIASCGAFAAGIVVSPHAHDVIETAQAQASPPPLAPAMIDLMALKHADLPTTANPEMNNRGLVSTANGTVAVQSGNVAKHMHPKTTEIQYIIEGSGTMWLGDDRKDFKPGTLIIIPNGTAHAGTTVVSGPVKALAIKIPPQPSDDTVFLK